MADTESLSALPRKEIQRQAKEAGIKANQTNEALIAALCSLKGTMAVGCGSANCTPKSSTAGGLGPTRRTFGLELSASKANQPVNARRRLLKTLSEDCASPILMEPSSTRKGLALASPGLQMGASPLVEHRLSTSSFASSLAASPDWNRSSKMTEQASVNWSILVEGDTIELTVARLRALGFGEEDARWAAEEAKTKREEEEGDELECDISLSLDLSILRLHDRPAQDDVLHEGNEDEQDEEEEDEVSVVLNQKALGLVFSHLNTWDLSSLTASTCRSWRDASVKALRNYPNVNSDEVGDVYHGTMATSEPAAIPQANFASKFPWGRFLAVGGFKKVFLVHNASEGRTEAMSVMDLEAMADNGNLGVADTEVHASTSIFCFYVRFSLFILVAVPLCTPEHVVHDLPVPTKMHILYLSIAGANRLPSRKPWRAFAALCPDISATPMQHCSSYSLGQRRQQGAHGVSRALSVVGSHSSCCRQGKGRQRQEGGICNRGSGWRLSVHPHGVLHRRLESPSQTLPTSPPLTIFRIIASLLIPNL